MLQDEAREAADKPAADDQTKRRTAEKLLLTRSWSVLDDVIRQRRQLRTPESSLSGDVAVADLHCTSLRNQTGSSADQFYVEALNAYGAAPMDQFLYLSSYPFGNTRDAGEMPGYTFYTIPEGFAPESRHCNDCSCRRCSQESKRALQTTAVAPKSRNTLSGSRADVDRSQPARKTGASQTYRILLNRRARSRKTRLFASLNPTVRNKNVTGEISVRQPTEKIV